MRWKEHPFATPLLTFAATMTFCLTIIIPIWDKIKDNEIASLRVEPNQLTVTLGALTTQLNRVESENLELRRELDKLRPDDLFLMGDYYPHGFRQVRIGDRIDLIYQSFSQTATIEDKGGWLSLSLKKPEIFENITYYFDESASVKTVTSILFHLCSDSFDSVRKQLVQTYGGTAVHEDNKNGFPTLTWSDGKQTNFELNRVVFIINPAR